MSFAAYVSLTLLYKKWYAPKSSPSFMALPVVSPQKNPNGDRTKNRPPPSDATPKLFKIVSTGDVNFAILHSPQITFNGKTQFLWGNGHTKDRQCKRGKKFKIIHLPQEWYQ